MPKPYIAIRIRVEIDRETYERAKKHGYKVEDIRQAIEQAGLAEFQSLLSQRESDDNDTSACSCFSGCINCVPF